MRRADHNVRPPPNYDNPEETLQPAIWGVEITMIILMTVFMFGRFYSRTVLVKGALGWDDWIMMAAYVRALNIRRLRLSTNVPQLLAIAQCGIHIWETRVGIGRHLYDVRLEWISSIGKITLVTQVLFGPTTALTKISICLTYLRLFPSKTNKWFNYVAIAILIMWGIACPLVMLFMCW
jgi:hypothetical protein